MIVLLCRGTLASAKLVHRSQSPTTMLIGCTTQGSLAWLKNLSRAIVWESPRLSCLAQMLLDR